MHIHYKTLTQKTNLEDNSFQFNMNFYKEAYKGFFSVVKSEQLDGLRNIRKETGQDR